MSSGATNAKVKARGLDNTGVTEDVARKLFAMVGSGSAMVAVVELEPVQQINDANGDHAVVNTLGFVEVAEPGSRAEEILRELARALYRDRRVADGELPGTESGGERGTDDVLTEASSLIDRDANGDPEGMWTGDTDDGGEEAPDVAPGPGADDASYDDDPGIAHKFMAGSNDPVKCAVAGCGKGARAKVHTDAA